MEVSLSWNRGISGPTYVGIYHLDQMVFIIVFVHREQKDAVMEKAKKESALASTEDFAPNLAEFVVNRPDLFGTVEDEVCMKNGELLKRKICFWRLL